MLGEHIGPSEGTLAGTTSELTTPLTRTSWEAEGRWKDAPGHHVVLWYQLPSADARTDAPGHSWPWPSDFGILDIAILTLYALDVFLTDRVPAGPGA